MFPITFFGLINGRNLVAYDIPTKTNTVSGYVVNPSDLCQFSHEFPLFLNRCTEIADDKIELMTTKTKYYNTLRFIYSLHENDNIYPYFVGQTAERIKDIEIDHAGYNQCIKKFEVIFDKTR